FWSDDVEGLMFSPPARQFAIANQLVDQYNLNLEEVLGLYLKLGFSLNDAAVATWKYKYQYMVMRPNVYIHEFIDPDFQTNLFRLVFWPNPSFPGYPSGHSCFASAAGGVFIDYFGDNTNFTDRSHEGRTEFRGAPRTFSTFSDMAAENAFSRIPLGVHIRMDCTEGLRLGYEIADAINGLELQRDPG
ncbi:MAG: vanadium-dependent haloperoxidase, partial [Bacteroidota bacterium]